MNTSLIQLVFNVDQHPTLQANEDLHEFVKSEYY